MSKDNLGDRMKGYEHVNKQLLTRRTPTIIRLDGRAFHSLTKKMDKPFDALLTETMQETAKYLCENIEGCKIAYTQSDEITLLLTDYDKLETQPWFKKGVQKMVSVSASMATLAFNKVFRTLSKDRYNSELSDSLYLKKIDTATFDSRAFNLPKSEVCNCFIWRQQDATKNAIQMVARAYFSHKECKDKNGSELQEMLFQNAGINFNDMAIENKRGSCIVKEKYLVLGNGDEKIERTRWIIDKAIPVFTQDRDYIEKYVYPETVTEDLSPDVSVKFENGSRVTTLTGGEVSRGQRAKVIREIP